MTIAEKLRKMHALAGDKCDPEFNRALLEAADEIERLRAALRDAHDDLNAIYPWAFTREETTIKDFQEAAERLDDKIFAALYPKQQDNRQGRLIKMTDLPMKHYYLGEDIETLPRERLIEIIAELGRELEQTRASAIASVKMMADIGRAAAKMRGINVS